MKELTVFILVSLLMGRQNNVAENVSVVDKVNHPFQCCNFVLDTLKKLDKTNIEELFITNGVRDFDFV